MDADIVRKRSKFSGGNDRLGTCETIMTASLSCHSDVKMKRNKVDSDISVIGKANRRSQRRGGLFLELLPPTANPFVHCATTAA